jgi:pimeloyl-ACP methyl ester carboxylesterase
LFTNPEPGKQRPGIAAGRLTAYIASFPHLQEHAMRHPYSVLAAGLLLGAALPSFAATTYGPELQGFAYPHPLQHYQFSSQGQLLQMAYMDVAPKGQPNGRTAVLMHGKNFCGATWEQTITALSDAGYRVVALDQVGFCASSKPASYQYTFQQLAGNTAALLKQIGVQRAVIVGHSTGGMLAARYALMYPDAVSQLVMVNPIGLEDWKALGVPHRSVDQWHERELKLSADSVRAYEKSTYYVNRWKAEYERWVDMLAGLNQGPGHKLVAWNSALIYDMIFTQPVVYEFPLLKMPVTLMLGDADTTAIGSDIAPPAVKAKIGRYDLLGKQVIQTIPQGELVEFHGLGHAPQMEDPAAFHQALLKALDGKR